MEMIFLLSKLIVSKLNEVNKLKKSKKQNKENKLSKVKLSKYLMWSGCCYKSKNKIDIIVIKTNNKFDKMAQKNTGCLRIQLRTKRFNVLLYMFLYQSFLKCTPAFPLSLIGGRHPEGSPSRWDHCVAQEDPRGHVHASVPSRPTRKHGLPAVSVIGPEGCHSHHDPPP